MASIVMLIGGAIANAFTSSSYLFSRLSKDDIARQQKRHDLVIKQLQKVQVEWAKKQQKRINFINKQLWLERKVEASFKELNDTMREYHEVLGCQLLLRPQELVLSNFYTMSNEQHDRELVFITLNMTGIGGGLVVAEVTLLSPDYVCIKQLSDTYNQCP